MKSPMFKRSTVMFTIQTEDDTFTIDVGPPMRLSDGTSEWIIVARPMPESFSQVSKGWYDDHPGTPEPSRRLQAWLEEQLIDWLPLASTETHVRLREAISAVARPAYTPSHSACKSRQVRSSEERKKLILRSASTPKGNLSLERRRNMDTYTIEHDNDVGDYCLTVAHDNTKGTFYSAVIPSASKIAALAKTDPRILGLWSWIASESVSLEHPVTFTGGYCQYGSTKIHMDTKSTHELVALFKLWNTEIELEKGFSNAVSPLSGTEDPTEVAELMDDIEAEAETEPKDDIEDDIEDEAEHALPEVYTKRVGEQDLPAKAWIQRGEIFGSKIEWDAPEETTLMWSAQCNLNDEAGIITNNGGWGYAGYEPAQSVYLRYNDALPGQEHCMRVVVTPGVSPLRPTKNSPVDLMQKLQEADEIWSSFNNTEKAGDDSATEDADHLQAVLDDDTEEDEEEAQESLGEGSATDDETDHLQAVLEADTEEEDEQAQESDTEEEEEEDEQAQESDDSATEDDAGEDQALMDVLASTLINKNIVAEWLEQGLESDPADMVGFITDLYETFVGPQTTESEQGPLKPVCIFADSTQPPQIFHLAPGVQYLLQVWTRDNRGQEDPPVTLIANSYQALANKFRKYAFKNRVVEDYLEDDEFEECIDEQCELIAAGNITTGPELHIAYLMDCYELSADQDSEKLISTESTDEEESFSLNNKMAKTNKKNTKSAAADKETIAVTEVAALFCDLGIGLAAHFDLDTDEVIEYLDGVCEDAIGANPDSATLFQKVKEFQDDSEDEEDEDDGEDDVQSITQSEFDDWFASSANGGLKVSELKANAEALGMNVTAKTKKQEIKDYMEELVVPDEDDEETEVDDEDTEVDDATEDDEETEDDDEEVDNESAPEDDEQDTNGLTTAQVVIWFMIPSKGGLKIDELRTQAKELGLEITNKTKKDEIKELMLELCDDAVDDDDEPESEENFEVYLEAPGAKKNKFWKCVVEDCEMTTTYGNVGNKGTSSTKSFDTSDLAIAAAKKLVQQKIAKGYSEPTKDSEEEEEEEEEDEEEKETLTVAQIEKMNKKELIKNLEKLGFKASDVKRSDGKKGAPRPSDFRSALIFAVTPDPFEENSDSESEEECHFVYTKGPQAGNKCTTKPKADAMFCGKHKDCKAAKNESQTDSEPESPKKKAKKGAPKTKSASTGQCLYVGTRGGNNGKQCEIKPKDGEEFCAKHATTQQALNYNANESPIAKKAGKKLSKESAPQKGPKIVRNKDAKVWVVEGEILVVKSPKNPTVYAYLTKKGTVNKKLSKAVKTLAEELGLEIV